MRTKMALIHVISQLIYRDLALDCAMISPEIARSIVQLARFSENWHERTRYCVVSLEQYASRSIAWSRWSNTPHAGSRDSFYLGLYDDMASYSANILPVVLLLCYDSTINCI